MIFRHWTTDSADKDPWNKRDKGGGPCDCSSLPRENVQAAVQGGKTHTEPGGLAPLKKQNSEFRGGWEGYNFSGQSTGD